ncbi:MAG: type II toxin-antitoxin system RelE/ParE family toxin [Ferruginibacter sp.]|nr:type II toxin-antitoxin system RelE/ParE family toxin [Ferruginibacter sp.]
MGKYILTNKAADDLSSIWNYTIEVWSEKQADKYYLMLLSFCQDLADGKLTGKNYFEVENELLGLRAGEHIVFYKETGVNQVIIVRILHSRMDYKNRLQE